MIISKNPEEDLSFIALQFDGASKLARVSDEHHQIKGDYNARHRSLLRTPILVPNKETQPYVTAVGLH